MRERSVWPECREAHAHDRCAGTSTTSECICWHHVLQQRDVEHALELLVQIERELTRIHAGVVTSTGMGPSLLTSEDVNE